MTKMNTKSQNLVGKKMINTQREQLIEYSTCMKYHKYLHDVIENCTLMYYILLCETSIIPSKYASLENAIIHFSHTT